MHMYRDPSSNPSLPRPRPLPLFLPQAHLSAERAERVEREKLSRLLAQAGQPTPTPTPEKAPAKFGTSAEEGALLPDLI